MKYALITGSSGLIGGESVKFFSERGFNIIGIDNDMRSYFFGKGSSTIENRDKLLKDYNLEHHSIDVRDYNLLEDIFKSYSKDIEIIIHCAAQPSHDWAAKEPITDFTINANGTLNLLELTRIYCPKSTFIFTSTNKVYGDRPNFSYYTGAPDIDYEMIIDEEDNRYEAHFIDGTLASIDENMSIDNSKHSVFGASKVSADIMCQEYGKYFNMNVGIFRGGCLTGPDHAGAEFHGFLSYLIKCAVHDKEYTIFGYKGKQVRDNIHSRDLVNMFWNFHQNPKQGEVYNAGGGRDNSTSIIEAIDKINSFRKKDGMKKWTNYSISEESRVGDHVWYISNLDKFKNDYPEWDITISLDDIIEQMYNHEKTKIM